MKPKRKGSQSQAKQVIDLSSIKLGQINYKNVSVLKKFLNPRYKILGGKSTSISASKQRAVKREIKKARIMGLLPYTDRHALKAI
jgi:small subunit ribosomal protein S18